MEDICMICLETPAAVLFGCGHRVYCERCCENVRFRGHGRVMCPIDRIVDNDAAWLQLQPVSLEGSLRLYDELNRQYPCGCLLFGPAPLPATNDLFVIVRQAIQAVRNDHLTVEQFQRSLRRRLTGEQYQLVYVELMKDADLRGVIQKCEEMKNEARVMQRYVREVIVTLVEKADNRALFIRAGLETVIDSSIIVVKAATSSTSALLKSNRVSNAIAFSLFSAMEIYRWSRGDITTEELRKNIGEHTVGAAAGLVGGWGGMVAGGAAGAGVGSMIPLVGTAIGAAVGATVGSILMGLAGDYAGRSAYRKIVPRHEKCEQVREERFEERLTPEKIAENAANRLGVNLAYHSFSEARTRFRTQLLRAHPDRNPNVSPERQAELTAETSDLLACWAILREHYRHVQREEVEGEEAFVEEDGYIDVVVLKVRETIEGAWRTVGCFFDIDFVDRPLREGSESLEIFRIFF